MKMTSLVPMLPVSRLRASLDFYEKLGFTVERGEEAWGWAMLNFDSCRLMLDESIGRDVNAARRSVVYLYPDDIVAYHSRVRAAGVAVPELADTFYDMREFRLMDPDGNQLWIGQPRAPQPPSR